MNQRCRRCMQDERPGSRESGHGKVARRDRGAKVTLEKTHRMYQSRKARSEERLAVAHCLHAHVESLEFGRLERSQHRAAQTRAGAHVAVGGSAHG